VGAVGPGPSEDEPIGESDQKVQARSPGAAWRRGARPATKVTHPLNPLVLDTGALIGFERRDRRVVRLLELAGDVHVPAGAIAQAWRNPARQVRLVRLLASDEVSLWPFSVDVARAAGHLCGVTGTDDVIDASVVLLARQQGATVVTSDLDDLRRLDAGVTLVSC